MRDSQAGFSLVEILIAAALFALLGFGGVALLRQLAANAQHLGTRALAYGTLERLAAQLRAEARSATALAVTASAGGGHDACDELAFATADAAGPHFWAYRRFPNHTAADALAPDALLRVSANRALAACDPTAPGNVVASGMTAFAALAVAADRLPLHRDPYLNVPDTPFVARPVAGTVPLGFADASGAPVAGGNSVAEVTLANAAAVRTLDLVAGVFPTGFTEVLAYTCDARCTVGHDASGLPRTITACALGGWTLAASAPAAYGAVADPAQPGLDDLVVTGWWIAGSFTFRYSGIAPDGSLDAVVHQVAVTNAGQAGVDGAHGTAAPFAAAATTGDPSAAQGWLAAFAPYVASSGPYAASAPLAREQQRCDAVTADGAAGAFSYD